MKLSVNVHRLRAIGRRMEASMRRDAVMWQARDAAREKAHRSAPARIHLPPAGAIARVEAMDDEDEARIERERRARVCGRMPKLNEKGVL